MKSVAFLLGLSLVLTACGGEAPEDSDPVVNGDSGGDADNEAAAEASADSAPADEGVDTADTGPTKLTCEGSEPEPNDTRVVARVLKEIDDCDGSGGSFKGVVGGGGDIDYWTYSGKDTTLCRVDVTASTKSGVRLCAVAFCKGGATAFKSCKKGLKTTVAGVDGCCSGPGELLAEVELEHSCTLLGPSDDADVWMRVDDPGGTTCKSYTVDYHF